MLKITQVKSGIRRKQSHKDTLRALGLKRLHHSVYHEDTATVRGMVDRVGYMVEVSEVDAAEAEAAQAAPAETAEPEAPVGTEDEAADQADDETSEEPENEE